MAAKQGERIEEYIWDEVDVVIVDKRTEKDIGYYPFDVMEVGKSFTAKRHIKTLKFAVRRYREDGHEGESFKVRELQEGGCRVWRVK